MMEKHQRFLNLVSRIFTQTIHNQQQPTFRFIHFERCRSLGRKFDFSFPWDLKFEALFVSETSKVSFSQAEL